MYKRKMVTKITVFQSYQKLTIVQRVWASSMVVTIIVREAHEMISSGKREALKKLEMELEVLEAHQEAG